MSFPDSERLIKKQITAIVLHEYKAVYWWIPKNACTSLKLMFAKLLNLNHPMNPHIAAFDEICNFGEYPSYLHFAVVRDPAARLYSLWRNKVLTMPFNDIFFKNGVNYIFEPYGDMFYNSMPFESFQEAVTSIPHDEADCHFMPQSFQIPESNIHILKLENIEEEYVELCNMLNMEISKLPHKNRTDIVNRELITLTDSFYKYYESDYKAYNYKII